VFHLLGVTSPRNCMKTSGRFPRFFLCIAFMTLQGCEYEWKDEPIRHEVAHLNEAGAGDEKKAAEEAKAVVPQSEGRPVLAPGKLVSGEASIPAKAKKLNLPELLEQGQLSLLANVPGAGGLELAVDEVESTLAKSEGINPFKITLYFQREVNIKAVRVLSSYSDYGWAVEGAATPRLVVDTIIDGQWSTIAWPEGMKSKTLVVEVLRKLRDNYVHVNEIEIYE